MPASKFAEIILISGLHNSGTLNLARDEESLFPRREGFRLAKSDTEAVICLIYISALFNTHPVIIPLHG